MNAPLPFAKGVTLSEIAATLCKSKQAIAIRATKENWAYTEETGRGGTKRLYPVSSLPKPIREKLQQHVIAKALPAISTEITSTIVVQVECRELTDQQRLERDARLGIKAAITRLMTVGQCSKEAAMHTLLANARAGTLDAVTTRMLSLSRDSRGRKGMGDGFPSIRSLKRWLLASDLAPKVPQKDMSVPAPGIRHRRGRRHQALRRSPARTGGRGHADPGELGARQTAHSGTD